MATGEPGNEAKIAGKPRNEGELGESGNQRGGVKALAHICVGVCVCVRMCVCVYVCAYVRLLFLVRLCVHVCVYVCLNIAMIG